MWIVRKTKEIDKKKIGENVQISPSPFLNKSNIS